jgi:glycerophosphoryl diester phosphodiesterase
MAERFLIFGHRGSPNRFPENTVASFEETLRVGADGFETDLRLLSDRTAVLFHDDELNDVEIESLSMAQCAERGAVVARLADLDRFARRCTMVLEVKRRQWEETLLEEISDWPGVIIASFDHSVIRSLHERGVKFPLGITLHGYLIDVGSYAARLGATWCFPNYRYVDEEMIASLQGEGVRVVPWTPNRVEEWDRLRQLGCDGIITDEPEAAVAWRAAMEQA